MSGGVPAGWVLVPVEPTLEMKDSATIVAVDTGQCSITALNWEEAAEVWSAMLSAVPTPTPPIEGRDADVERVAAECDKRIVLVTDDFDRGWNAALGSIRAAFGVRG